MRSALISELQGTEKDSIAEARKRSPRGGLLAGVAPEVKGVPGLMSHHPWSTVLATALFHPTVELSFCSTCPVGHDVDVLTTAMDAGVVTPVLTEPYGRYRADVLASLHGRPHVGRAAMAAYAQSSYCKDHKGSLCQECFGKSIMEAAPTGALDDFTRHHIVPGLREIRPGYSIHASDVLTKSRAPWSRRVTMAGKIFDDERARLLGAVVYHPGNVSGSSRAVVAASGLGIACPATMQPTRYLAVVERHKGSLASIIQKGSDKDVADAVKQINGEVRDLMSPKSRVAMFVIANVLPRVMKGVAAAAIGGAAAGPVGAACGGVVGTVTPSLPKTGTAARLPARCIGASQAAARVFQIRQSLKT